MSVTIVKRSMLALVLGAGVQGCRTGESSSMHGAQVQEAPPSNPPRPANEGEGLPDYLADPGSVKLARASGLLQISSGGGAVVASAGASSACAFAVDPGQLAAALAAGGTQLSVAALVLGPLQIAANGSLSGAVTDPSPKSLLIGVFACAPGQSNVILALDGAHATAAVYDPTGAQAPLPLNNAACAALGGTCAGIATSLTWSHQAVPSVGTANGIYCQKTGTTASGGNVLTFAAADCGGTLPDGNYTGAMALAQINGGNAGYAVQQASGHAPPGLWFFAATAGSNFAVGVVYLKKTAAVSCIKAGTTVAGANTVTFAAADCAGVLPPPSTVGLTSTLQVNGGNGGFAISQPFLGEAPGQWFFADQGVMSFDVSTVFVPAAGTILCKHAGSTTAGGNSLVFTAADCGGTLPDGSYLGALATLQVNGGDAGFAIGQPAAGGGAGIWFYAVSGGTDFSVAVAYMKR